MKRFLLMIFLIPAILTGADIPKPGTLIVTYQTDGKNEHLDRVRFWLKNEMHKQTLYPRGTAYVDDGEKNTRMVVVEDLQPGDYVIDFIFPNLDSRFKPIPERKIKITSGEVVKIDQKIKPKKTLRASRSKRPMRKTQQETATTSVMEQPSAVPEPIIAQSPLEETEEEDTPDEQEEIDVSYGKLIVSYELPSSPGQGNNVRFRVISQSGQSSIHPELGKDTVVPLEAGKMVMVPKLPSGIYTIEFILEGLPEPLAEKSFELQAERTKSVHQTLTLPDSRPTESAEAPPEITEAEQNFSSLTLTANIPTAEFELRHLESGKSFQGQGREASFEQLPPGKYELNFNSYDPFFIPPPSEKIEITEGDAATWEADYMTLGRVKISTNITRAMAQITPMEKGRSPYKKEVLNGEVAIYIPEGKYRITFQPVKGRETPEPVDINVQPLQTEQVNVYFPMD